MSYQKYLGYAFCVAWVILVFNNIYAIEPNLDSDLPGVAHLLSTLATLLVAVLMMLAVRRLAPLNSKREALYLSGVAGGMGTGCAMLAVNGTFDPLWMIPGFILIGIGAGWIELAWEELFALCGVRGAALRLMVSTAIGALVYMGVSLLAAEALLGVAMLLPVAAAFLLRPAPDVSLVSGDALDKPFRGLLTQANVKLVAVIGIVYFAYAAIRTLDQVQTAATAATAMPDGMAWIYASSAVPTVLAAAIALLSHRVSTIWAFYIGLPTVSVAALLMIVSPGSMLLAPLLIVTVGSDLLRFFAWFIMIGMVLSKRVPALFCFALLRVARFSGILLGQAVGSLFASQSMAIAAVILVALLGAALIILGNRSVFSIPEEQRAPAGEAGLEQKVARLAELYGLSPREQEILAVWTTGHNSAYVEKRFHISKNTVKTHLSHIYAKSGVANREELLHLIEKL